MGVDPWRVGVTFGDAARHLELVFVHDATSLPSCLRNASISAFFGISTA
jgi:hypothetical protein